MTYIPKYKWPKIKRAHERVPLPYGYMEYFQNPRYAVINPDYIEVMEKALSFIDTGISFSKAAEWLGKQTGKKISNQGMSDIWWRIRGDDPNNDRAVELKKQAKLRAPRTGREAAERLAKQKLGVAKRQVKVYESKVEALQPKPDLSQPDLIPSILPLRPHQLPEGSVVEPEVARSNDPLAGKNIVFQPNPGPQSLFLAASEREVLYGGAAGGGKSFALLADPMRYFSNKNFRGIIFRRTNDELRELKFKAKELYEAAFGKDQVTWREKDSEFVFASGARLWFTYLERDDDVLRYQGQAFTYIGFDELTQYPTRFPLDYMRSRLRDASGTLPLFVRCTTNPGGPGHGWVKRMFIDPAPAGKAFDATDIDTGEVLVWGKNSEKAGQPLFQRRFIPARLSDNKYLAADGEYEANLLSQSEQKRRQLLDGDWTVADGAAFGEWREPYHTCEPFEIPAGWRRFRSCDYGYNSFSAVHWFAIDPVYETLVLYRELYVTKHTGKMLAARIRELEQGEQISYGMLDSSVWAVRGQNAPTVAEEMIQMGVKWRPSDRAAGSRAAGKNRLHELLIIDEDIPHYDEGKMGRPGLVIFNTCRQIISDLPVIPADPDGKDDIDVRYASDHTYDSVRYGIMSRPRSNSPFTMPFGTYEAGYRPADRKLGL